MLDCKCSKLIVFGLTSVGIAGVGVWIFIKVLWIMRRRRYKQGTIILHTLPKGRFVPAVSPYVLKLETYMRLAKIPYEYDTFMPTAGPKGKLPWITLNGKDYGDSQLIIELLNKKYNVNLNSHLNPETNAALIAFRVLTDEFLFWTHVYFRIGVQPEILFKVQKFPAFIRFLKPILAYNTRKAASVQGVGRHSKEEVIRFGEESLRAISTYLGNKLFMGGDEPSEADCSLFGHLAQLLWSMPGGPYEKILNEELVNIKPYCERIKARAWPDWDRCLNP